MTEGEVRNIEAGPQPGVEERSISTDEEEVKQHEAEETQEEEAAKCEAHREQLRAMIREWKPTHFLMHLQQTVEGMLKEFIDTPTSYNNSAQAVTIVAMDNALTKLTNEVMVLVGAKPASVTELIELIMQVSPRRR